MKINPVTKKLKDLGLLEKLPVSTCLLEAVPKSSVVKMRIVTNKRYNSSQMACFFSNKPIF